MCYLYEVAAREAQAALVNRRMVAALDDLKSRDRKLNAVSGEFQKWIGVDEHGRRIPSPEWKAQIDDEARRIERHRKRLRDRTTRDRDWKPDPPPAFAFFDPPPIVQRSDADIDPASIIPPRPGLLPGDFLLIDPRRLNAALADMASMPPAKWSEAHVGSRLIEAHAVLRRIPEKILPAKFGAAWPAYRHEGGELAVQAGAGTLEIGRNRVMIGATSEEIARMNEAFGWLLTILKGEDRWTLARLNGWAEDSDFFDDAKVPIAVRSCLRKIACVLNKTGVVVR